MKTIVKFGILAVSLLVMLLADLSLQLLPDAEAVYGTRRRTARRTAVVVGGTTAAAASASVASAEAQAATAQQQAAAAQQQAAASEAEAQAYQQQAEAAQAQAAQPQQAAVQQPTAAPLTATLPIGAVLTTLPSGCTEVTVEGVQYQACGPNYLRAAFQGNQLVYVATKP